MDYCIETAPLEKLQNDCLIVGFYQDKTLSASAEQLDRLTQGALRRTIERDELSGKNGEAWLYNRFPGSLPERVVLVGLGENKTLPAKKYRKALAAAAKALKDAPVMTAICTLAEVEVTAQDFAWKTRQIVEVFEDVCYQKAPCKSEIENKIKLKSMRLWATDDQRVLAERGLQQGRAIAAAVALTKELGDLPGNICTPSYLAEQAQRLATEYPTLQAEILEESDMAQLGMGALLAVSRGSRQPAKLITLRYQGGNADAAPFVLVGKGLTFDAGGISIKAAANMDEMKYDMCGGATVLGVLQACARLALPLNVIGLVPASENLPDGNANKPGDILTSMSGKTIEVLNTDAEGRLILCDTLTYAKRFQPQAVIDIATLTGACIVALGRHPSGLMANDETLCQQLINASERACDSVWRLPLWEEYQEQLKSNFADLANIGGPDGGAITAGCFLSRFAEEFRWAHLDIAGTAWRTGNHNKGATGRPVPLLVQYLLDRAAEHA